MTSELLVLLIFCFGVGVCLLIDCVHNMRAVAGAVTIITAIAIALAAAGLAMTRQGFYRVIVRSSGGGIAFATVHGPLMRCEAVVSGPADPPDDAYDCAWNGATVPAVGADCPERTAAARHYGAMALIAAGLVLSVIAAPVVCHRKRRAVVAVRLAVLICACVALGAGTLLAYDNVFWAYCGPAKACDAIVTPSSTSTCSEDHRPGLYIFAAAVGVLLVAVGLAAVAVAHACRRTDASTTSAEPRDVDGDDDGDDGGDDDWSPRHGRNRARRRPPTLRRRDEAASFDDENADDEHLPAKVSTADNGQQRQNLSTSQTSAVSATNEHPGGDWVWDEAAQLWWSDSNQMYLDRRTGCFYHPKSGKWFHPAQNRWLKPHELQPADSA